MRVIHMLGSREAMLLRGRLQLTQPQRLKDLNGLAVFIEFR
jgi:hypothetical protein